VPSAKTSANACDDPLQDTRLVENAHRAQISLLCWRKWRRTRVMPRRFELALQLHA
jgi:hypothetical protein